MSVRNTVRAFPSLLRIGFAEAVAYRVELFVWILTTTMPLIMLALWLALAREGPVGRFHESDFVLYFLSTFAIRQLTNSWAFWEINFAVRSGTLSTRLLRPVSPVWSYAIENLAAVPLRLVVALPVAAIGIVSAGAQSLPSDLTSWSLFLLALIGAWMITFFANVAIGAISLFVESSLKWMDVWLVAYAVFSGYLVPIELFPAPLRLAADWLPFRYQIGLPVELFTGAYDVPRALEMLARQWAYVGVFVVLGYGTWCAGLRRYGAYGG